MGRKSLIQAHVYINVDYNTKLRTTNGWEQYYDSYLELLKKGGECETITVCGV